MRRVHRLKLQFRKPAGTSRGVLTERPTWIYAKAAEHGTALGEAGPLSWLSPETAEETEAEAAAWEATGAPTHTRAGTFAAEMLARDDGRHVLFPSPFTEGKGSLRINGLVWMGPREAVEAQIRSLLDREFRCIKMKVGAADWAEECAILRAVRAADPDVELRVDANGAFSPAEAKTKLHDLAEIGVRSIEQPIAPGQPEAMAELCAESPIAIALDEELIRADDPARLLDQVQPQGIVLKPTLLGGFAAAERWAAAAEQRGIFWWATSALESTVGLNALAQWLATRVGERIQGLGTGGLYVQNIGGPLVLEGERLRYDPERSWDLTLLTGSTGP